MVKHVVLNQPEAAGTSAGALPHPTSAGAPSREGLIRNSLKKTHSSLMDEVSNTWAMGGHEQGWVAPSRGWAADKPCVQELQLQHFLAGNIQVKWGFAPRGRARVPSLQHGLHKSTSHPPPNPFTWVPLL